MDNFIGVAIAHSPRSDLSTGIDELAKNIRAVLSVWIEGGLIMNIFLEELVK